ncbi:tumor protein D54 isoform X4 [Salmo salar]|uniref:Tumor protein D54 isoform X4 n=1 Tax=Salmo salar TaxID=8030 RepID=A0A1S3LGK8_SALSA|nr:tumor protein D54-like isoform X4 [Salmo salar]|eukprot:XP_013989659.1 PREDICTED: tumor protein D54-like isoform X3 [Salmo salar]
MDVGQACPPAPTLSLDPDINLNSPNKGLGPAGGADPLTDVPVEGGAMGVSSINTLPPGLTEEEAEEIRSELGKVEEEINTLRQVLLAKEKHSADLKRKLGLSPLNELKQNLTKGWQDVQTSNAYLTASATLDEISRSEAYKKTQETLSVAGQKTTAAFSTMGTALSRKLGDMSSNYSIRHSISMPAMRNSPTFKSFEDKVGNMKYKVVGARGNGEAVQSPTDTNPVQDNAPF